MPKNNPSNYQYLAELVSELKDDHSRPWSDYPCLQWDRTLRNGRGMIHVGGRSGRMLTAHRAAFEITHGDPGELCIYHRCDNVACFRPIHLFAGKRDIESRFMAFVSPEPFSGCWLWMGGGTRYGHFAIDETDKQNAHRVSWKLFRGPIPDGLVIDHLCKNIVCVNPRHLEPVTQQVNVDRSTVAASARRRQAAKTCCAQGHPFDGRNKRGTRTCSICRRAAHRAEKARKRALNSERQGTPRK